MQAGERLLVDWRDDSIDAEAWLDFSTPLVIPIGLRLSKVDPEADFSYDYEDLAFTRVGDCTMKPQVDALMRDYTGDVPGASVLVLRDGQPVVRAGYGLSDLETHTPATATTNYRLASVTKQFTAASILLLAEDGKLKLDDHVRKWLPTLPKAAEPITIRHLLTHTSGLIDYEDVIPDSFKAQLHDADVLQLLESQDRLYFHPGSDYRYSNSGYSLLALIVERASGPDLRDLPARAHLPAARHEQHRGARGRHFDGDEPRVRLHRRAGALDAHRPEPDERGARRRRHLFVDRRPGEVGRRALRRPPVAAEVLQSAFTPATHTDDPDVEYGYGWRITGETLWHSGETVGFRNVIVRYPKRHLTVVVLTNRNEPEPYKLALAIAKKALSP